MTNAATGVIQNLTNFGVGTQDGVGGWPSDEEKFAVPADSSDPSQYGFSLDNAGLISAHARGVAFSSGGYVENSGHIEGGWAGVLIQDVPYSEVGRLPAWVVNTSTGTITVDGSDPYGSGITFNGYLSEAYVSNQGDIFGSGNAIESFNGHIGMTIDNLVGGRIVGNADGVNGGAAIQAIVLQDLQVRGYVQWLPVGDVSGDIGSYPDAEIPALVTFRGLTPIAPLVDENGNVVTDGNGNPMYPDVDMSALPYGLGTVSFYADETGSYYGEDESQNPVHYFPPGSDFTETVVNDGEIFGDVNLGIGNDVFSGAGTVAGTVHGGDGNDQLTAGSGDVFLLGEDGDDTLASSAAATSVWMEGGPGMDVLDSTAGVATISYEVPGLNGVIVNVPGGTATDNFGDTDTLLGSNFNVHASYMDDNITLGDGVGNYVFGRAGSDVLTGGLGPDRFTPGSGSDTIVGGDGPGLDFLVYFDDGFDSLAADPTATMGIVVHGDGTITDGWGDTDTYSGIEVIQGSAMNDTFVGTAGIDIYWGDDGIDTMNGGDGDDWIGGGGGADLLSGGAGVDVFTYFSRGDFGDTISDLESGEDIDLGTGIFGSMIFTGNATFSTPITPTSTNTGSTLTSLTGVNKLHTAYLQGSSTLVQLTVSTANTNTLSLLGTFSTSASLISFLTGLVQKNVAGTMTETGVMAAFAIVGTDLVFFTIDNTSTGAITNSEIGTLETIASISSGVTPELYLV